jgi:hypothetical protein
MDDNGERIMLRRVTMIRNKIDKRETYAFMRTV